MKRLLMLMLFPVVAFATDITLSWTPPDTYEDGSPLPIAEIQSYRFEYSIDGVSQPDLVAANTATSLVVTTNQRGNHCFVGYTISVDGLESAPSIEQPCKAVTRGRPRPPRGVRTN